MNESLMKSVTITNQNLPQAKPLKAVYCDSFLCRLRGLMFRSYLSPEEGLLLVYNRDSRIDSAIHMLFMWIDLAVIWIDSTGKVVDTCHARRWRAAYVPDRPACYVLETHVERLEDFRVGDQIYIDDTPLV